MKREPETTPPTMLSCTTLADHLGITVQAVRKRLQKGVLPTPDAYTDKKHPLWLATRLKEFKKTPTTKKQTN